MSGTSLRERLRQSFTDHEPEAPLAGPRAAAIALILSERDGSLEVLLIERATRDGDPWSGHMALPGGHAEPADQSLAATAARETLEEVGLDLQHSAERLGRLSDVAPIRGVPMAVRPFVYLMRAVPALSLSGEVRQALWIPIAPLQRGERRTTHTLLRGDQKLHFPAWDVEGRIVWGLTYRVLSEFFDRLTGVSTPPGGPLDNAGQPG